MILNSSYLIKAYYSLLVFKESRARNDEMRYPIFTMRICLALFKCKFTNFLLSFARTILLGLFEWQFQSH